MKPSFEPRFAKVAALLADPTRAKMLAVLLSGQMRSAGELASAAGVTPQAASTQLAQLEDGGLISSRKQGRHRYFMLADANVAHALEALSLVAQQDAVSTRWDQARYQPLKHARSCYGHLAGELGIAQLKQLVEQGYLIQSGEHMHLTPQGQAWVEHLGLQIKPDKQGRMAYPCVDWSERQDHMAGPLAKALLDYQLEQDWLQRVGQSRALRMTPKGQRAWAQMLSLHHS